MCIHILSVSLKVAFFYFLLKLLFVSKVEDPLQHIIFVFLINILGSVGCEISLACEFNLG